MGAASSNSCLFYPESRRPSAGFLSIFPQSFGGRFVVSPAVLPICGSTADRGQGAKAPSEALRVDGLDGVLEGGLDAGIREPLGDLHQPPGGRGHDGQGWGGSRQSGGGCGTTLLRHWKLDRPALGTARKYGEGGVITQGDL